MLSEPIPPSTCWSGLHTGAMRTPNLEPELGIYSQHTVWEKGPDEGEIAVAFPTTGRALSHRAASPMTTDLVVSARVGYEPDE